MAGSTKGGDLIQGLRLAAGIDPMSQYVPPASQASQLAIGMLPGAGIAGAMGYGPKYDSPNNLLPSGIEKGPSLLDNAKSGNYGQAGMQLLGAVPDVGYTAGLLKGVNPAMKAIDKATGVVGAGEMDRGMFAGIKAKTADLGALKTAEELEAAGKNADDIWRQTGWGRGADNQWRFEIDDSGADLARGVKSKINNNGFSTGSSKEILDHQDLYDAYPKSRAAYTTLLKSDKYSGSYSPQKNSVTIKGDGPGEWWGGLLHEHQHGIQQAEGFARGASVSEYANGPMFDKAARDMSADFSQLMTGGINAHPAEWMGSIKYANQDELAKIAGKYGFQNLDDAMKFLSEQDVKRTPFGQYLRTSGEVEARNVQHRSHWSQDRRRDIPPWKTEDTPRDQQIVRFWDDIGK